LLGRLADAPDQLTGSHGVHVVDGASLAAQHPVRPGRAVRVEAAYEDTAEERKGSALPSGRVADVVGPAGEDDEKAVAGGEQMEVIPAAVPVRPDDGAPLAGPVVENVYPALLGFPDGDELERGLPAVVGEEEGLVGGEEAAPGAADSATPEEGLGWKARQDLPENDLLGEPGLAAGHFCHP
jgi:hypothetical protein